MTTIIGYGEMARAIIEGLGRDGVQVVGRDGKKLEDIKNRYGVDVKELKDYDIEDKTVILAVKPHALEDVAKEIRGRAKTLISILAGINIKELKVIDAQNYVRAMPNIAAAKKASMTALTGDIQAKEEAEEIFNKIGQTLWLESEEKLDIATAIAGSGPAFLALVAEAFADGGVACGLKRDEAYQITEGLFKSYAAIADNTPSLIKDRVMSPAGTTAAGYGALERNGVRSAFMEAVAEAFKRAKKQ